MESLSLTRSPLTAFAPLSTSLSRRGLGAPIRCLIKDKSKLQKHSLQLTKRTKLPLSGNSFLDCMVDRKPKNQTTGLVSSSAAGAESDSLDSSNTLRPILSSLNAFYRFSRPHTIIGTALSIVSVSLLALESLSDVSPLFFTGVSQALVAALFMNVYIVGLNQVFDIEIDKVNKPNLPLASGEYSLSTGVAIVSTFAILSFGVGWLVGSWPLFWALFISFILGTAYSINMPFLRWKRFAVVAALCILAVRAVIVQLAFFLHIKTFVFRQPASFSKPLIFATAFMTFFSVVIALFKDIPDIEGDRIFGIQSFSVRLGKKRVFWICVYLLEIAYTVAMLMGATSSSLWSKLITIWGHAFLASILWNRARSLDLANKSDITSFYMFIWKKNPLRGPKFLLVYMWYFLCFVLPDTNEESPNSHPVLVSSPCAYMYCWVLIKQLFYAEYLLIPLVR